MKAASLALPLRSLFATGRTTPRATSDMRSARVAMAARSGSCDERRVQRTVPQLLGQARRDDRAARRVADRSGILGLGLLLPLPLAHRGVLAGQQPTEAQLGHAVDHMHDLRIELG